MKPLFRKLLGPRQTEYFVINHNFIIQETSAEVQHYADSPGDALPGADARISFPELVGIENILMSILMGRRPSFELKGIARFADKKRPLYFDMLAVEHENEQDTASNLLVLIEDATEKMVMKQSLIQRANEANLLASALAASKDYIDKVIRSMGDALLVTTTLGIIKTVNQSAQWLFGYSEPELIDHPLSKIVVEETLLYQARHRYILSQKEFLRELEVICTTKAGAEIWVEFSCSAIQTELEGLYDFVYIGRDVTERKQQELEIRRSLAKEQELRQVKSRFFSMLAHEFGNPLNTVLFATQILKEYGDEITNEEKKEYLKHVKSASKHMAQLLDDVRLLSSAESGKLQFNPAPVDLQKFCTELVESIKISYGKNHQINFICRTTTSPAKKPDRDLDKTQQHPALDKKLLRHILTNLLSNAVKYSPIDSNIYFQLNCHNEKATFKIKDAGIGIPIEDQAQLFESYYRAQNVGKISGTGLGLSIVKQCVDLHGGQIEFSSETGLGTRVSSSNLV
ncbi:PAS domain-containing sensor histidine kinase [Tychonema sp. LEGE 07203]|uniref:PAS domain-containing sensor histidine kinase n=1 Tax=Tychonema sp. LEGE 07203 TaxID=1828671 RepID=UPI00187EC32D|nr:PAS domain-containing sensor histidine kinase [Tychonema sp. LEGE 07203]MBE9095081.1 PAS domain S-box protein [Tychonema sp. LEGE 07203]